MCVCEYRQYQPYKPLRIMDMFLNKMGDPAVRAGKSRKLENGRYGVSRCLSLCGVEYGLINCLAEVSLSNHLS